MAPLLVYGGNLWLDHQVKKVDFESSNALDTSKNMAQINLDRPDVVLSSQNLADFPKDVLRVPLLKALLSEEALFFYETDEDWLGLKGAFRRIAYEHELNWQDELLSSLVEGPVDIYMWRDAKGALRYWAIALERRALLAATQKLAEVKFKADKQVSKLSEVDGAPVWVLALNSRRKLVLVSQAERLVILASPKMLSGNDNQLSAESTQFLQALLSSETQSRKLSAGYFGIDWAQEESKHTLVLGNGFLTQGYEDFAPTMQALRLDFKSDAWQTQVRLLPSTLDKNLWQQVPANAAFCGASVLNWDKVDEVIKKGKNAPNPSKSMSKSMTGAAAACWYAESRASTPLVLAQRNVKNPQDAKNSAEQADYEALFNWAIKKHPPLEDKEGNVLSEEHQLDVQALKTSAANKGGLAMLERKIALQKNLNPVLGYNQKTMYFSIDGKLVKERANQVSQNFYPTLADVVGTSGYSVLMYVNPKKTMALLDREAKKYLTQEGAPTLRAAYDYHMPARIKAVDAFPAFVLRGKWPEGGSTSLESNQTQSDKQKAQWYAAEWMYVQ